jgi:S1-C subfamily serine protease
VGRVTAGRCRESIDLDHDLAVLEHDGPPMPALRLGDSSTVRDGQDVAVDRLSSGAVLASCR